MEGVGDLLHQVDHRYLIDEPNLQCPVSSNKDETNFQYMISILMLLLKELFLFFFSTFARISLNKIVSSV